ncbi:hypothetical protein SAMN04487965_0583 [Microbulbifer donghaiensis]|uniref:Uncharacterized protein n=1 Tax=Microbulbifer donghaiensis TaxID=494016 RepID=A0A1M4W2T4_9GAMM|nr:ribonucleotide reductase subunit alpha [Microbulbifer donghaiensis]SHE75594.1 hypothetical protein SAMN04487965_0583 [Microbulbifer donghaiensis]
MQSNFQKLIEAAQNQPQPQRLLFLLAKAERNNNPKKSTAKGAITPVMCVDKLPEELSSFADFIAEADGIDTSWNMILIAGLNGENGQAPTTEEAEPLLNKMANDLMQGQDLSRYLILDREENQIEMMPR